MFWIGGQINQFKNWLDDWAQRVVVNRHYSDRGQGSLLGPVVLKTVISDLKKVTECTLIKFADDTKLGGPADTLKGKATIQSDLDRLEGWATRS